ncbi:MAG TPA: glutaredoxin family protein [Vicinamibacteria bacterium]|nr:glutaredoxin family protein [Vicinamibacteria bacterium]
MTSEPLLLVGKPRCHLCEVMREVVSPVAAELGLALAERDVRSDPELDALYRNDIPVLLLGGREVARHRVSAADLRTRLRAMRSRSPY